MLGSPGSSQRGGPQSTRRSFRGQQQGRNPGIQVGVGGAGRGGRAAGPGLLKGPVGEGGLDWWSTGGEQRS